MKNKLQYAVLACFMSIIHQSSGALTATITAGRTHATVSGTISEGDIRFTNGLFAYVIWPDYSNSSFQTSFIQFTSPTKGGVLQFQDKTTAPNCPTSFECAYPPGDILPAYFRGYGWPGPTCPATGDDYRNGPVVSMRPLIVSWINSRMPMTIPYLASNVGKGEPVVVNNYNFGCFSPSPPSGLMTSANRVFVSFTVRPDDIAIVDPTVDPSVCSISDIPEISFSSFSKDVNGLKKSESVSFGCGAGNPQHYKLRLTGNADDSGRLLFSSGVAAKISFNSQPLNANGTPVELRALVSGTATLDVELVGTAPETGVSHATGVLILENL